MIKKLVLSLLLASIAVPITLSVSAAVVRSAPNFTWLGKPGASSLKAVKGQPVVLVMAKSPRSGAFRKQVKVLRKTYEQFASRGVIFAAAFIQEEGTIPSDIPFAIVQNGPAVTSAYEMEGDFRIAIIGKDGNLDYVTSQVLPASRVQTVIQNSFEIQAPARE